MHSAEIDVRRASAEDVAQIARIHVESWRSGYRGQLPDAVIEAWSVEDRQRRWLALMSEPAHDLLVALRAGAVAGFCSLIPSRDLGAARTTGEIAALYVASEHWRAGVGRRLMLSSLDAAHRRAYRDLTLWVLSSNARARAFYESVGFVADGTEKVEQRWGHDLHELRYQRSVGGA